MEIKINNELGYTEVIIEEEKEYKEDYQMAMLRECKVAGLIPVLGCGVDECSRYIYDVSGMQSMAKSYEKSSIDEYTIRQFSRELLRALDEVKHYMLDINRIMLKPELIYKKGEEYYFTYYPLSEGELRHKFHELSQYFVQHIDYSEVDAVVLACGLHKSTMEGEYELTHILEELSIISQEQEIEHEGLMARDTMEDVLWMDLDNDDRDDESDMYTRSRGPSLMSKLAETPLARLWNR